MAKLSAEKQKRIKQLLLEGKAPAEVAKTVDCSVATAERYHAYWLPEIRESLDRGMARILKESIRAAKRR